MTSATRILIAALLASWLSSVSLAAGEPKAFVHPGLLHAQADLERMKAMVSQGVEPWKSGFERLQSHPQSHADWRLRGPFRSVVRDPKESRHIAEMDQDANAAYQNAIMWCVTGRRPMPTRQSKSSTPGRARWKRSPARTKSWAPRWEVSSS